LPTCAEYAPEECVLSGFRPFGHEANWERREDRLAMLEPAFRFFVEDSAMDHFTQESSSPSELNWDCDSVNLKPVGPRAHCQARVAGKLYAGLVPV
jgi:hypothetical protein